MVEVEEGDPEFEAQFDGSTAGVVFELEEIDSDRSDTIFDVVCDSNMVGLVCEKRKKFC